MRQCKILQGQFQCNRKKVGTSVILALVVVTSHLGALYVVAHYCVLFLCLGNPISVISVDITSLGWIALKVTGAFTQGRNVIVCYYCMTLLNTVCYRMCSHK